MLQDMKRLCDRLDHSRARVLGLVEATDEHQRSAQPAEGKWSMLQVVEHLVLAEEGTLRVFEQGPPPEPKVKVRSLLALRAIEGLFGLRARLPVPSKSLAPPVSDSLEPLRARWTTAGDGIIQY
ncbi:MAG: DinB family protein, partial [Gemmatimonadales bacterium]|nr:DinB family protein [Gemmatimonadales bacterium]